MLKFFKRLVDAFNAEDRMNIVEYLADAIGQRYKGDPTTAGLVIAKLLSNGKYYVSVVRYREKYGEGKEVVCSESDRDLYAALYCLTRVWFDKLEAESQKKSKKPRYGLRDYEAADLKRELDEYKNGCQRYVVLPRGMTRLPEDEDMSWEDEVDF